MKLTFEIFLTSYFFSNEDFSVFYLKTIIGWTNNAQIRSSGTVLSKKGKVYRLIGGCVLTWSKRRLRNVWRLGKEWKWTVVDKQVSATVSWRTPSVDTVGSFRVG